MMVKTRFASFRNRLVRRPATPDEVMAERGAGVPPRPHLVVGLGNPDAEYRGTRHNVGAWCIERLASRHGHQLTRGRKAWTATIDVDGRRLHLARPRAYVNQSGGPVAAELKRLKLRRQDLLVIYDELDLPLGQVRIRPHGGHGGHNGMRSVIGALGEGDFPRIRIGIDRPYDNGVPVRDPDRIADWVLSQPSPSDREALETAAAAAADAVELALREGIEIAMNRLNTPG